MNPKNGIDLYNDKFKALGGVYNITYITPYYFHDLKFKALGTVYNISVREMDKYHDLIDFGGFKRKWIHKNNIGNCRVNFNGKKYQSYNMNGNKPDLYFFNHKHKIRRRYEELFKLEVGLNYGNYKWLMERVYKKNSRVDVELNKILKDVRNKEELYKTGDKNVE